MDCKNKIKIFWLASNLSEFKKNRIVLMVFIINLFFNDLIAQNNFTQTGNASYYHDKFNGKKTASGEIYNSKKYTAAHKTLPFGTIVKVTNLKNNKVVVVTVNDRGPFKRGRIIDLSKAAAQEIDLIKSGIAKVKIEALKNSQPNQDDGIEKLPFGYYNKNLKKTKVKGYGIQVFALTNPDNILNEISELNRLYKTEIIIEIPKTKQRVYRFIIGNNLSKAKAKQIQKQLQLEKKYPNCFVRKI